MRDTPIILAGETAGITSLYKGMKRHFTDLSILTSTPEIVTLESGHRFIDEFDQSPANLVVMSGYRPLLSESMLAKKVFLNIHYGPLPRYRGMHPVVWGILNNEVEFGWTLHQVDAFMDSGPIIYQYRLANDGIITSTEVMQHFHDMVADRVAGAVAAYIDNMVTPVPQSENAAYWCGKRNFKDCYLTYRETRSELKRIFRALIAPYPYPRISYKGVTYELREVEFRDSTEGMLTSGRVYNVDTRGCWIRFPDCYLFAKTLWTEDNKPIRPATVFKIGVRLDHV